MTTPLSATHQYLLANYGPLLTMRHLAQVLPTSYSALRMNIARGRHPLSVGLAAARRRVGRRIYFDAGQVAQLLDDDPAQSQEKAGGANASQPNAWE